MFRGLLTRGETGHALKVPSGAGRSSSAVPRRQRRPVFETSPLPLRGIAQRDRHLQGIATKDRTTEVGVAVHVLTRMLEPRRPISVRIA